MNAPVVTRRSIVAGAATALGAAALPLGIVEALVAELPRTAPAAPTAFDPVAFVSDLEAARCDVILMTPGTAFGPSDEVESYFIRPSRGYTAVMAKWSDAIAACPDHVARVTARLAEMRGVEL